VSTVGRCGLTTKGGARSGACEARQTFQTPSTAPCARRLLQALQGGSQAGWVREKGRQGGIKTRTVAAGAWSRCPRWWGEGRTTRKAKPGWRNGWLYETRSSRVPQRWNLGGTRKSKLDTGDSVHACVVGRRVNQRICVWLAVCFMCGVIPRHCVCLLS